MTDTSIALSACGALPRQRQAASPTDTARAILECLFRRRSLAPGQDGTLDEAVLAPHLPKVLRALEQNLPVEMVLPAFPGKSPNRQKTLGPLPDLAEHHALDELGLLCEDIRALHAPGAIIRICSDGYVFSDLVRVPDAHVQAYTDDIQRYADQHHPGRFSLFDLKDAYAQLSCLDSMREELMIEHGQSLRVLQQRFENEEHMKLMYCGIHRFLAEDYSGLLEFAGMSMNAVKKVAKPASQRVIQRSEAWSALLQKRYPHCLRLSIHPQLAVSSKIGIRLVPTSDLWRTPWHSVAVKRRGVVTLDRRSNVDERYSRLVFRRGRPCHYASAH
ncbi:isocyanide synthase family protein [Pseudomonas muyukensis]|uniref:Isocyanide synthase family protein n=1 Tax=Pseudomonas muyukensis TaxID=2842357 RepID=A0ABX8M7J0_9PSED|nr:isocyanide synthase family protein [Pseudomonas muyukensis]QXH35044.1 isocyanide synthase family protein [Pseudomonas muyukensis]